MLLPTPKRRLARLDKSKGIRREMARVHWDMESGKHDTQDGSRSVYVLSQIAKVLELTEIERRLTAIEERTHG